MIYTDKEKLRHYDVSVLNDRVQFREIIPLLMECPSNMIYCEKDGILHGIISMGDIARASSEGKDYVEINRRFTYVSQNESMRARQIFKENDKINALPVVNHRMELLGDYSRWDDLIAVHHFAELLRNKAVTDSLENKKIVFVRPCKNFQKKQILMRTVKEEFEKAGIQADVINREEAKDVLCHADYILFTDEDEIRGTDTLCRFLLKEETFESLMMTYDVFRSCLLIKVMNASNDLIGNEVVRGMLSAGVPIISLCEEDNGSDYYKFLKKEISAKWGGGNAAPIIFDKEMRFDTKSGKDFFSDLYSDAYIGEIRQHRYEQIQTNGVNQLKDADSRTYRVVDGERRTIGQPSDFQRCIYFLGKCLIIGRWVSDEHTIESFLQARLNASGYKVKCVNYGAIADKIDVLNRMASVRFRKGDIVVLFSDYAKYEGIPTINLIDVCEKHQVPAEWMIDRPCHCNHKLNSLYADEIFETIEPLLQEEVSDRQPIQVEKGLLALGYLERYFHGFLETHHGIIGSIVMNCNPFTLGHRYLIEQALKQVDHLIVFVVEEDRSLFTFKERFAMVVEGTKDLQDVTVAPSGNFILSQTTFPEYFLKIKDEDIVRNVEYDITLFAEQIAPKLNIAYRFVGEEPDDGVTNEYNEAMKRILPAHGINIVEIPRAKADGRNISASRVREMLSSGECENIDNFIPQTTKDILELSWG